jgi:hypothetical protein
MIWCCEPLQPAGSACACPPLTPPAPPRPARPSCTLLQAFVSYKVVSTSSLEGYRPGRHEVIRRFRDFTWLKNRLRRQYMGERRSAACTRLAHVPPAAPVPLAQPRPLVPALQVPLSPPCPKRTWWKSTGWWTGSSSTGAPRWACFSIGW